MKVSRKALSALLVMALTLGFSLAACGGGGGDEPAGNDGQGTGEIILVEEGKLIIGSDCDYPPFVWMEGSEPVGFEIDLMQAIADDLGLELVYLEPQNFDALPTILAGGGKIDLIVSSLTITDERKEIINFCIPYFNSNQACVTLIGSEYESVSDLDGKTVGAQGGTTGFDWCKENLPNSIVLPFNQTSEGLAALRAGEIEALIFDEPVAFEQVSKGYDDCQVLEVIPTGEQYGFGVSKDNPALEAAVNASLQKMIDNGTYAEIFARYFDFEPDIK